MEASGELQAALASTAATITELPHRIGGRDVYGQTALALVMPHEHQHVLARTHLAESADLQQAMAAAASASEAWERVPPLERAAVFLRAADLLTGPWHARITACAMLEQSKTVGEAADDVGQIVDAWREAAPAAPETRKAGFVLVASPFHSMALAARMVRAPALRGETVVWNPAEAAALSAHLLLGALEAAGLPPGVVNVVHANPEHVRMLALHHPAVADVQVEGNTSRDNYIFAHPSASIDQLADAVLAHGFDYQGQKLSSVPTVYAPASLWPSLETRLCERIAVLRVGDVREPETMLGAVINEAAWLQLTHAIGRAWESPSVRVRAGGWTSRERGWFVEPTLLEATGVAAPTLRPATAGPIVTVQTYPDRTLVPVIERVAAAHRGALLARWFGQEERAPGAAGCAADEGSTRDGLSGIPAAEAQPPRPPT